MAKGEKWPNRILFPYSVLSANAHEFSRIAQHITTIRDHSCLFLDRSLISGEGRHYFLREQADGIAGRLRVQVPKLVTGAENVMADQLMLFL